MGGCYNHQYTGGHRHFTLLIAHNSPILFLPMSWRTSTIWNSCVNTKKFNQSIVFLIQVEIWSSKNAKSHIPFSLICKSQTSHSCPHLINKSEKQWWNITEQYMFPWFKTSNNAPSNGIHSQLEGQLSGNLKLVLWQSPFEKWRNYF